MVSENKVVSRIPRFTGKERKILRRNVENRLQISPEDPSAVEVLAALNEFEKSMPKTSKKKASTGGLKPAFNTLTWPFKSFLEMT